MIRPLGTAAVLIAMTIAAHGQVRERDTAWVAPPSAASKVNPLANRPDAERGGRKLFDQRCAACHGDKGVNPSRGVVPMVGPKTFDKIDTMKTVPYYKYATTLFDVIRRSMPYPMPRTLTNDEVYAVSAYILSLNKIIGENDAMNAETLPKVKMPNADNFMIWDPSKI